MILLMTKMIRGGTKVFIRKPKKLSCLKMPLTLMSSNTGEFLIKSKSACLAYRRGGQEDHHHDDGELP